MKDILDAYNTRVLTAMVKEHGLNCRRKKRSMVEALARRLGTRPAVERALAKLTPVERQVLEQLQSMGGETPSVALKGSLIRAGAVAQTPPPNKSGWKAGRRWRFYEANPRYRGQPCYEDVMARLTVLGLVFSRGPVHPDSASITYSPGNTVFIPEPVRAHLPPPSAPAAPRPQLEPAQVVASSARTFQRDLGRYWRYVRRAGGLNLTTQGWVYKKELQAINDTLSIHAELGRGKSEKDNDRLWFLRRMLLELGLLEEDRGGGGGGGGRWIASGGETFWGQAATRRVRTTFEAWRDGTHWNELLHAATDRWGYDRHRQAPKELAKARRAILEHVTRLGAGRWVEVVELVEAVRTADYEFLFPRDLARQVASQYGRYYYYYDRVRATPYHESTNRYGITYPKVTDEAEGWQVVEGAIITHVVAGPLFWMGLVDLGYPGEAVPSGQTPPLAYRLTPLGAWVLGLGGKVDIAEEGGRVVVQPNFQLLAMEPISDEVLITLDQFADAEGGDRVMSYKLSRASVYRGQRGAWPVPRIVEYLEKASGGPLPANVRRSLEEWDALHRRITFRRGVPLAQAAGAATLDALLSDPAVAQALGRRVAGTVTLPPGDASQAAGVLRQAGWLPLTTPAGQRQAPPGVQADDEGRLRFAHPAPSIYLYQRITPFSQPEEGGARITPETVQAALQAGATVDSILQDLAAVHSGDLPPRLVLRLKAWGHYYGDAALQTLTLVEFRDQAALAELCADPELSPYLTPFPAGQRPLATVRAGTVDEVRRLLAKRGITVSDGLKPS